jgi:hypothetical protein
MFRKKSGSGPQPPEQVYERLRTAALEVDAALVGGPSPDHPDVLGAVVDIPRDDAMASVVAMADGTTSMYTSTGGGTIGAGAHESVASATKTLLTTLQRLIDMFPVDERTDVPSADLVQVTVITPTGRRRASLPSAAFWGREPSTVVELIAAIHGVISALRELEPS